ncbi:hypothetical protein ADZ36_14225 [Streptomyces fradiae]|uniref:Uncharacterized protein n=1 Tax=Streptomyces fradiae TaxID=1906 RepID=A0ACC4WBE2_STRFR|nr:hypothetical protein ADZ36_14225 [Streptomyces fradiae]OFA59347.1 hypothetical protein BEN35_02540 [Streptomyces fradiae]
MRRRPVEQGAAAEPRLAHEQQCSTGPSPCRFQQRAQGPEFGPSSVQAPRRSSRCPAAVLLVHRSHQELLV